jgi:exodeoxyribonuclease VII large subunit
MTSDDLFTVAKRQQETQKTPVKAVSSAPQKTTQRSNVPEMSVSDLAQSLKRTLEETYGRVRIRGELQGIKVVGSGHMYGDIKDVDANINIVCWRGNLSKLSIKPADGMDVIITGRVSSYPKSSRYQIIIEAMELAGEGALLKMLEERRKKLAAEGLFAPERKKPLPFLPETIGVITSPTGAVIRDIMHRLRDRFPRHVYLWPVNVQGDGAADQITNAINGFNQLNGTTLKRPDLLIVARGGGSLEDLMAFNEENVVRATANSAIPIISAVGHETDTTIIDYAADLRAPTPTGAAEMAVPRRLDLMARIQENNERLLSAVNRLVQDRQNILATQSAKLGDPKHLLESKSQTIDYLGEKLSNALKSGIYARRTELQNTSAKLTSPKYLIDQKKQLVTSLSQQLSRILPRHLNDQKSTLENAARMLQSLSPKQVLARGYTLVYDEAGKLIRDPKTIQEGQNMLIEFANEEKIATKAQKKLKKQKK